MLLPKIITGDNFVDERGELRFVNNFNFEGVKRFYHIQNANVSIIRAWQGHKIESKYFYAAAGRFVIAWVLIDNWENPSNNLKAEWVELSIKKPSILFLPPGYANGIKAIEPNSSLMVYSNKTLEESNNDRFSFTNTNWFNWE